MPKNPLAEVFGYPVSNMSAEAINHREGRLCPFHVIVALDEQDQIIDFGALEVQAVYISGNVSKAFKEYMKDPAANYAMK
ncbi:MAG TPA: NotI family restriction endonuclease [Herpetosiphonaceae bacterium]